MRILNLFAGIGGNRTLWGDKHEITAVEYDQRIAMIYLKRFPNDTVIVGDAYEYFINHFHKYDFVWASPPCTTHTKLLFTNVEHKYKNRNYKVHLPDLKLYSLIIFCKHHFRGKYLIENVNGYYKPLVYPTFELGRHLFWSNFNVPQKIIEKNIHLTYGDDLEEGCKYKGVPLELGIKNKQLINNCVVPEIGKYILDCAIKPKQSTLEAFR